MAKREQLGLTAVRTEGAILPASILQRIHREDPGLDGLKPEQYELAGDRLREAASRAWNALQGPWMNFKAERAKLAPSEAGTTITRNRWLYPILRELHFGPLEPLRESLKYDEKEFPVSHTFGHAPLHLIGCNLALDKRTPGAVGAARMSPHGLLQSCLNSTKENLWGFVTNGLQWRVLRDDNSLSRQSMVEFDLEAIFEGQLYDEFLLFFLICHRSRVQSELPEQCWLEQWSQAAGEDGKRALNTLRDGVQKSIEVLGQGFLRHPANNALRTRIRNGELDKQDYYRQLLRMVYRLLFLFVAEDRGLLLDPKATDEAKALFNEHFSTQRLRLLAEGMRGSNRHHDLFVQLKLTLTKLGQLEGCPELALPALGGFLFSASTSPDLDASEIANADLLESIRHLAVTREGGRLARVDYKNLGTEEFGSVYESLLELHPDLASDGTRFELITASGNERKTTGSYYTPDPLIQCLLDTALDPVVDEAVKKAGTDAEARAKAILNLSVIDPAVGSGHFLIAASHRLAKRLAQIRTGDEEPSPDATRHAMRDVIGKCLYGIDMNPMAAELCKVSLWIEALEPGKPLNFLDHHIVVGNSLLGTTPELIAQGIPDAAFDPIEGDDKELCKALKKRNKEERGPQGSLFAQEAFSGKNLLDAWRALDALPDETLSDVQSKEKAFQRAESAVAMRKLMADTWCSAFVVPKVTISPDGSGGPIITTAALRRIANAVALSPSLEATVRDIASKFTFLHPHLAFPEVFSRGGFDIVIGNPPWGTSFSKRQQQILASRFSVAKGRLDSAAVFSELMAQLAKKSCRIGAFLPDMLLHKDYLGFRNFCLNELNEVTLVGFGLAFEGVTMEVFSLSGTIDSGRSDMVIVPHMGVPTIYPREAILRDQLRRFNLRYDKVRDTIAQHLEAGHQRFRDLMEPHEGVHSGNIRAKLFVDTRENDFCRKLIRGAGEVRSSGVTWAGWWLNGSPDLIDKLAGEYANLGKPHWFVPGSILIRRTGDEVICAVNHDGFVASNNLFVAVPRNESVDVEWVVTVLNSKFITWLFRFRQPRVGQAFAELKIVHLNEFPIPPLSGLNRDEDAVRQAFNLPVEYEAVIDGDLSLHA